MKIAQTGYLHTVCITSYQILQVYAQLMPLTCHSHAHMRAVYFAHATPCLEPPAAFHKKKKATLQTLFPYLDGVDTNVYMHTPANTNIHIYKFITYFQSIICKQYERT